MCGLQLVSPHEYAHKGVVIYHVLLINEQRQVQPIFCPSFKDSSTYLWLHTEIFCCLVMFGLEVYATCSSNMDNLKTGFHIFACPNQVNKIIPTV